MDIEKLLFTKIELLDTTSAQDGAQREIVKEGFTAPSRRVALLAVSPTGW